LLTLFTTPKPFRGHIGIIQRNALWSWKLLAPDVEVILFGDEDGAAGAARDISVRHEAQIERNALGTPYVSSLFDRAQELARHDLLCYVNCDILLLSDFLESLRRVSQLNGAFLMSGRRWDTDVCEPLDFASHAWEAEIRRLALQTNRQRSGKWIDYFAFPRGLYYKRIPPFAIGRPGWDNWMLWHTRRSGARLVDASAVVVAVHQNHDYLHPLKREQGGWESEGTLQNSALLKDGQYATLENATHLLTPAGLRRNWRHWPQMAGRRLSAAMFWCWFTLLRMTRPLRDRLGLRRHSIG
jgi:hypothetical protein